LRSFFSCSCRPPPLLRKSSSTSTSSTLAPLSLPRPVCQFPPHSRPDVFGIGGHLFPPDRGPGVFTHRGPLVFGRSGARGFRPIGGHPALAVSPIPGFPFHLIRWRDPWREGERTCWTFGN
jgi:hypothetical protein